MRKIEHKREHKRVPKQEFEDGPCSKCKEAIITTRGGLSEAIGFYCPKGFDLCDKYLRYRSKKLELREENANAKEAELKNPNKKYVREKAIRFILEKARETWEKPQSLNSR